jgi:hypothetical protein
MPHELPNNLLEQIDGIVSLNAGFPFLKAGIIQAVKILKEKHLRWKISDRNMREELSQERATQMPLPTKAIEICLELLAKIAVDDKSALRERKRFHQKGEPALVISAFFKQQGKILNMFFDEEWYQVFIVNSSVIDDN